MNEFLVNLRIILKIKEVGDLSGPQSKDRSVLVLVVPAHTTRPVALVANVKDRPQSNGAFYPCKPLIEALKRFMASVFFLFLFLLILAFLCDSILIAKVCLGCSHLVPESSRHGPGAL
jgi:hypothetical protein